MAESNKLKKLSYDLENDGNNNIIQKSYPSNVEFIKTQIAELQTSLSKTKVKFNNLEENLDSWKSNINELKYDIKLAVPKFNCFHTKNENYLTHKDDECYFHFKKSDESHVSEINSAHNIETFIEIKKENPVKSVFRERKGNVASRIAFFEKLKIPPIIRSEVAANVRDLMKGIVQTNVKFYEKFKFSEVQHSEEKFLFNNIRKMNYET